MKHILNIVLTVIFGIMVLSLLIALCSQNEFSSTTVIGFIIPLILFGSALICSIIKLVKHKKTRSNPTKEEIAVPVAPSANIQKTSTVPAASPVVHKSAASIHTIQKVVPVPTAPIVDVQIAMPAPEKSDNSVNYLFQRIPNKVLNLLWFANGTRQNYFSKTNNVVFDFVGHTISISSSILNEPSAIYIDLPIDNTFISPTPLDYFPSYEKLTPQERAAYINWLTDITTPIDIGYVFIFYYGLERHLLFGNSEDALKTILLLRKYHKNDSILFYSGGAVVLYSLIHNKLDILQSIDITQLSIDLRLLVKVLIHNAFSAEDIIDAHAKFGFTNTRYIKNEPQMFLSTLEGLMIQKYSSQEFQIKSNDYASTQGTMLIVLANYSLSTEQRQIELPDITTSPRVYNELNLLLTETHEAVKIKLREQRKVTQGKENL